MPPEGSWAGTGLPELLELENDPAFAELACPSTGVLAWPAIRNDVFRLALSDALYSTAPIVDPDRRPSLRRVALGAFRAAVHNVRHPPPRSDVLFLATGAGLLRRNHKYINRYVDGFADALGDRAWTMEGLFADAWPDASRWNQRLGFLAVDRLRIAISMRTSIGRVHRLLASNLIELVVDRGRDKLGWRLDPSSLGNLRVAAERRLAVYPLRARLAEGLLKQTRARLVVVEEGCYGHLAVFNATARERGLHLAEFQHGMITLGHDAYNVHPLLRASDAYRRTQPHSILTYGEWWNTQFNAPVVGVAIGNPHRGEQLRTWRPAPDRALIIVLGDGVETGLYLDLCRDLAAKVPSAFRVVFRPHPWERERAMRISGESFDIDTEQDLYRSFTRAGVVVGESSTAIFEAAGLVPRIAVWDTLKSRFYLGDHPFARFATASELADQLAVADSDVVPEGIVDTLWASEWRRRFLAYVADPLAATA